MDWTHIAVALFTAAGSLGGAGLVAIPKVAAARRAGRRDALEEWQTLYQTEKERNAELHAQVAQLKQELDSLKKSLASEAERCNGYEGRVRELEDELRDLRRQVGQLDRRKD